MPASSWNEFATLPIRPPGLPPSLADEVHTKMYRLSLKQQMHVNDLVDMLIDCMN